jgi:hypothetical protein
MNGNATVSKQLLQNLIDSAAEVMKLNPIATPEQKVAYLKLDRDINAVINAVTQITASPQSFGGSELGGSSPNPSKSSFV